MRSEANFTGVAPGDGTGIAPENRTGVNSVRDNKMEVMHALHQCPPLGPHSFTILQGSK